MASPKRFFAGPWVGVHEDTGSRFENAPNLASAILNGYIPNPEKGSEVVGRPGTITGTRMGTTARIGQGDCIHTALDGTVRSFAVCDGKVYRYNTGTQNYTDVSPASGCTISTSARVYLVPFGDSIIVSDSTNKPWVMTGLGNANVTATEIDYNGSGTAWVAYGRPTVYAAKVFFICKTLNSVGARNAIMWSEEGSAATGYQQSGYDNLWELTQNASEALTAIHGTNAALVYFRAESIGLIAGQVDSTFQTTATRDQVSTGIGTTSPDAVTQIGDKLYFLDANLRPYRLSIGGSEPESLWNQLRRTLDALNATGTASFLESAVEARTSARYWPAMDLWVVVAGADPTNAPWVFDTRTGRFIGTWQVRGGAYLDHVGLVRDALGRIRLLFLGGNNTSTLSSSNRGYPYTFNWPGDETVYARDGDAGSSWTAITVSVTTHPLGLKERQSYQWYGVSCEAEPGAATVSITTDTAYTAGSAATPTGTTASYQGSKRYVVGLARTGPYAQVTVSQATTTGTTGNIPPRLTSVEATALPLPLPPFAR